MLLYKLFPQQDQRNKIRSKIPIAGREINICKKTGPYRYSIFVKSDAGSIPRIGIELIQICRLAGRLPSSAVIRNFLITESALLQPGRGWIGILLISQLFLQVI
jgi:hypothetical protein